MTDGPVRYGGRYDTVLAVVLVCADLDGCVLTDPDGKSPASCARHRSDVIHDPDWSAPCATQTADQPAGSTWTFIRRRQRAQNRGGSSSRAAVQPACDPSSAGSPQRSHQSSSVTVTPAMLDRGRKRLDRHLEFLEQGEIRVGWAPQRGEVVAHDHRVDAAE